MRVDLMGTPVDVLSTEETLASIERAIRTRTRLQHVALNVAKLVSMRDNLELRDDVNASDIVGIDGMGIVLALRMKGIPEVNRVAGVDLMLAVLAMCADKGFRPYFLGATPETVREAVTAAQRRYPQLQFAGSADGYFSEQQTPEIMQKIQESQADCLFIGMPTPRKERLLREWRDKLNVPFIMGVGGSLDVLAGKVNRAPLWMQDHGLEWLYRIYQEPGRMWWRYASTNTRFIGILLNIAANRLKHS